jgi:hypothetical protein
MRLLATIVATAAVFAFTSAQNQQVLAQGADTQTGVSTSQGSAGGQERHSGKASAKDTPNNNYYAFNGGRGLIV